MLRLKIIDCFYGDMADKFIIVKAEDCYGNLFRGILELQSIKDSTLSAPEEKQ